MKITNKTNLADSLYKYLITDNYDYLEKGDSISATELLNPAQLVILKRRYHSLIEVDAIDRVWVMLGNGIHKILEDEEGIEKIERLKTEVLGRVISGKFDRIINNKITDFKCTSAWSVVYGSREEEWVWQLSIYRWLYFKQKGVLLEETGSIVAILRDWSEKNLKPSKYGKVNEKYPKAPAIELNYKLKSIEETEAYVTGRVAEIIKSEKADDDRLPECTDAERWYNETKKDYLRCAKYCEVNKFCKQFQKGNEVLEPAEEVEVKKSGLNPIVQPEELETTLLNIERYP